MSRPLVATIKLNTLRDNYQLAKRLHGGRVLAVVKANAYGHGALPCAMALEGIADGFAVASIEEALSLRQGGIRSPILLLEGWFEASELPVIDELDLWTGLHRLDQIVQLEEASLRKPLHIWLKIDSGMHRLGITPHEAQAAIARLRASGKVEKIVGMTHFARADELDDTSTLSQVGQFRQAIVGSGIEVSLANSGGILAWPSAHADWGRAGIVLYGGAGVDRQLPDWPQPVMQLDSRIIAVRDLPADEYVGYGSRYMTSRATRVGVVACGYADGYPRAAVNGTPVLVDGLPSQVIGRVSMDMLTVDLTDLPLVGVDTPVRLWGEGLPADTVAAAAGTISYELFCNVKRARFDYIA